MRTAWAHGISTNPIIFFGRQFFPDFEEVDPLPGEPRLLDMLKTENYPLGKQYFDDLHDAIGNEPGLLFWDVANEPGYRTRNFVVYYPDEPDYKQALVINTDFRKKKLCNVVF